MNPRLIQRIIPVSLALTPIAGAVDIFKANNNTSLSQTASWTGAVVPAAADVAVWDAPFSQTNGSLSPALGGATSWQGIRVASPVTVPRIKLTIGVTLTLGTGGIDMSAATNNFDLYAALIAGASQPWNVASGRTLTIGSGFSGGAGVTVTKSGPGTVVSMGSGTTVFSGNLALDEGTFQFAPPSGAVQSVEGSLGGVQPLTKAGVGALTLSGNNSAFSGGITLGGGTLNINHASALGTGVFALNGGGLDNTSGSPLTLDGEAPMAWNSDFTFTGASNLDLADTAISVLNNRTLTVSGGVMGVGGSLTGNPGASLTKLGAGTLESKSGATIELDGKLAVGGGVLKITGGSVACGSAGGNLEVSGGASVELNGGTLTARSITRTSGTGSFRFNGGTLKPRADSPTFITGLDSAQVSAGGAVLDLDGWFVTIAQPLLHDTALGGTPDGGLILRDATNLGNLTLTGASTYTGPTIVESGTLILGPAASLVSPTLELQASGTLDVGTAATLGTGTTLQGAGSVLGNLTIGSGATLSPGGTSIGTLTMSDTLKLLGNSTFEINKSGSTLTNDAVVGLQQVTYGGTLTVTATGSALAMGNTFKLFDSAAYTGDFTSLNLPSLPAGLFWDIANLYVSGSITVVGSLPAPSCNPPGGLYVGSQSVSIKSNATGAVIHYTLDGSDPFSSPTVVTAASPVSVVVPVPTSNFTIKAYATVTGSSPSTVSSSVYQTITRPTWLLNGSGDWSDTANWMSTLVANGSGVTADFGTLNLTGDVTVTLDGNRTLGGLRFGDLGNSHGWLIDGSSILTLDGGGGTPGIAVDNMSAQIAVPIAGSGGFTKTGAGSLVLSGNNTYGGTTTINQGVLQIGTGSANGSVGTRPYVINSGAKLYLNHATAIQGGTGLWSSNITGAGTLELNSAQAVNASANWGPNSAASLPFSNGFTGTLQVDRGRLDSSPAGLGGISSIIIKDGAQLLAWSGTYNMPISIAGNGWGENGYPGGLRLAADSTATWMGSVTLTADSGINMQRNGTFTITGSITGNYLCDFHCGAPVGVTAGSLIIAPAAAVQNSYGSTKITGNGGTTAIVAGNAFAFSTGGLETTSGGTLQLNGFNFSFANLKGAAGTIGNYHASNASVITVGSDHSNTTFSGLLTNGGAATLGLTKTGNGNLTLATAQSYTGPTTVNAGTLTVDGSLASGSPVTVAAGGSLAGIGSVNGSTSVSGGGSLAPGDNGVGTLAVGATTLAGTYQCQVSGATTDKITVTGNLNLTGSTLGVSTVGTATPGTYVIATYTGTLTGTFASVTPGNSVDYSTPNQVKLVVTSGGDPYQTWASGFGLSGNNALASADPDMDGIANSVEFVLGGNPASVANQSLLPTAALVTNPGGSVPNGDYLRFTYRRTPASAYLNPDMQFDADLIGAWTSATGAPGAVQVVTPGFFTTPTAADKVDVYVPRAGNAVNGKLFGRLRVINP